MSDRRGQGWLFLAGMALCHALSDFYATVFTPLVETFRAQFGLDEAKVAIIGAVIGVFGSMVQPLFGMWSDRSRRGLMAAVGLAVSAVFVCLIGLAPSAVVLGALLTVGALGVAAFHPSSAVLATQRAPRRSIAMGYFLSGGGVGLALAPLVSAWIVKHLGLPHLWIICFPGLLFAVWIYAATRGEPRAEPAGRAFNLRAVFARGTGSVWTLFAMATLRSLVITAFAFFASVLGATRGLDVMGSGLVLSLFLGCSVVGSVIGGHAAQVREPRSVLAISCIVAAPLFYFYAASRGWPAVTAFGLAGLFFGIGNPVNVSFAQELRPKNASTVTGLMMGLAWGVANVLLIPIGALAKHIGIDVALQWVAWLGLLAGGLAILLPRRPAASVATQGGGGEEGIQTSGSRRRG